jgi:hypothetical protein
VGLVAEMGASFEQLLHRDDIGRHRDISSGFASVEPCHQPFGWHRYGGSTCGMGGPLDDEAFHFKRFDHPTTIRTYKEQSP